MIGETAEESSESRSTLVNRNVTVSGHRTSMRLEPEMWNALEEICLREKRTVHEICSLVDARRSSSSLTAAMRVFILGYFRAGVTEQGHAMAGHGTAPLPDEDYAYPLRRQSAASG
jgi:predicted DNA-binding ribbon-helix-helix protein